MTEPDNSIERIIEENNRLKEKIKELSGIVDKFINNDSRKLKIEVIRKFADEIPVAVYAKDVRDNFKYIIWNSNIEKMFNLPKDNVIGRTDPEIWFDNTQAQKNREDDMKVLSQIRVLEKQEEIVVRSDGDPIHVKIIRIPIFDEKNNPDFILGIVQDVSEITAIKQSRTAAENKYQSLYDNMEECVALHEIIYNINGDAVDYRILDVNPAYEKIIGISSDKAIGAKASELYNTGEAPYLAEYSAVAASGKSTVFETHFEPMNKYFRISVFSYEKGKFATVTTDITCEKQNQIKRIEMEEKFQQSQKLESLGILAGGIAHDFNNLLMGILGNADLALIELSPISPICEYIKNIEDASRRAAELCRQMLAYSGRGRFIVEPLNISELITDMEHIIQVSVAKNTKIRFVLSHDIPMIDADVSQIRQILMNLVINASEAIGEKSGLITIRTGLIQCEAEYLRETYLDDDLQAGDYVFLEVSDNGSGMKKEIIARIFEPFFTTKFTGRGLGMPAVLGIVRGHKGAIKIYSEIGQGSVFKIFFPSKKSYREPKPSKQIVNPETETHTILLVDDEAGVLKIGEKMVKKLGFNVITAVNGKDALSKYKTSSSPISCVLLDLTMPELDGESTLRELKKIDEGIHVILTSGYSEQEVVTRFAGKGISGFLQKPYQLDNLAEKLKNVLKALESSN